MGGGVARQVVLKPPFGIHHHRAQLPEAENAAAAADAGAVRAVHVSSLAVLGTKHHRGSDESAPYVHGDPYTDTKIESERVARELGTRGPIEVKGIGRLETWLLKEERVAEGPSVSA